MSSLDYIFFDFKGLLKWYRAHVRIYALLPKNRFGNVGRVNLNP